jgi:hypothetical protein
MSGWPRLRRARGLWGPIDIRRAFYRLLSFLLVPPVHTTDVVLASRASLLPHRQPERQSCLPLSALLERTPPCGPGRP